MADPQLTLDSLSDATTSLQLSTLSTFESSKSISLTKEDIQKIDLAHRIELLKLELSQKDLLLQTLKEEHATALYDMEEKLSDAQHGNKMFSAQVCFK